MTSTALLLAWRALRCNTCAPAAASATPPPRVTRASSCMHGALSRRRAARIALHTRVNLGIAGDGLTAPIHCLSVRTGMSVASHTATSIATARMAAMESGRMVGMRAANSIGI